MRPMRLLAITAALSCSAFGALAQLSPSVDPAFTIEDVASDLLTHFERVCLEARGDINRIAEIAPELKFDLSREGSVERGETQEWTSAGFDENGQFEVRTSIVMILDVLRDEAGTDCTLRTFGEWQLEAARAQALTFLTVLARRFEVGELAESERKFERKSNSVDPDDLPQLPKLRGLRAELKATDDAQSQFHYAWFGGAHEISMRTPAPLKTAEQ